MRKMLFFFVVLALTLSVGLAAAQDETIKVGAVFALTGPTSDVGTPYSEGVRAYVDWVNSNGGVEGRQIELLWEDYAYQVPTAENLYTQYVDQGVVAFMGWGTGDTEALRGRVAEDQIPFMSASYAASLNDPAGAAPYNFLVGTTYSDQMVIMLQYMLDEWVAAGNDPADMKVAFFHHDSPFGTSPLADGEAFAAEKGIQTTRVAMPAGATDLTAELESADAALDGMTHIIIQNVSANGALLVRNAAASGLKDFVQIGCLNWCADELLTQLAGEDAEGVLGALPFGPTTVDVPGLADPAAYLEANDKTLADTNLHFTQGWWTMAVMVEGIRKTLADGMELTGPNLKASLEALEGFDTGGVVSDLVTFTPEDHRGNRSLNIFTVEGGVWSPVTEEPINLRTAGE